MFYLGFLLTKYRYISEQKLIVINIRFTIRYVIITCSFIIQKEMIDV